MKGNVNYTTDLYKGAYYYDLADSDSEEYHRVLVAQNGPYSFINPCLLLVEFGVNKVIGYAILSNEGKQLFADIMINSKEPAFANFFPFVPDRDSNIVYSVTLSVHPNSNIEILNLREQSCLR